MQEINYKDMKFNPFNLIGGEWMLVTAGDFSLCVMDKSFKKQMAYLGSVSGRDEDKIGKAGLTPVYADET